MSICRKFASLAHSKEHGYAYDSQAWDPKAAMDDHFRMFQTYGDGLCQHSNDWPVTVDYTTDYLASLAVAMQTDDELVDNVKFVLSNRPNVKAIRFAASVLWKENKDPNSYSKRRYFSVAEEKISSSPSKQYDKRYQEITDVHDGSPNSIYRILIPEYADGMQRYAYASAIRDWVLEQPDMGYMQLPGEFLNWSKDAHEARKLRDAYEACWNLIQANICRHTAQCAIDNYRRSLPQPETKTEAA